MEVSRVGRLEFHTSYRGLRSTLTKFLLGLRLGYLLLIGEIHRLGPSIKRSRYHNDNENHHHYYCHDVSGSSYRYSLNTLDS